MPNQPKELQHEAAERMLAEYLRAITSKMPPAARKAFEPEARAHILEHARSFERMSFAPGEAMLLAMDRFGSPRQLASSLSGPIGPRVVHAVRRFYDPCLALPVGFRVSLAVAFVLWAAISAVAIFCPSFPTVWDHNLCYMASYVLPMLAILAYPGLPRGWLYATEKRPDWWLVICYWVALTGLKLACDHWASNRGAFISFLTFGPIWLSLASRIASRRVDFARREAAMAP